MTKILNGDNLVPGKIKILLNKDIQVKHLIFNVWKLS